MDSSPIFSNPNHALSRVSSHIDRLPAELIAAIFTFCKYPIVVSTVSARWRSIANSSSTLWTNVKVVRQLDSHHLPLFLKYSRTSLLDVKLKFSSSGVVDKEREFDLADVSLVVSRLRPHFDRIRSLELMYPWSTEMDESQDEDATPVEFGSFWAFRVQRLFDIPAPQLETLQVDSDLGEPLPDWFLSGYTPRLRIIRLSGYNLHRNSTLLGGNFPLQELTIKFVHPEAAGLDPDDLDVFRSILRAHAPTLCDITFDIPWYFAPRSWDAPSPIVILTSLTSLSISGVFVTGLGDIHAPKLQTLQLDIEFHDDGNWGDTDALAAFADGADSVPAFLTLHAPTLEDVRIKLSNYAVQILDNHNDPTPCDYPVLRNLEITTNLLLDELFMGIHATSLEKLAITFDREGMEECQSTVIIISQVSHSLQSLIVESYGDRTLNDIYDVDDDDPPLPRLHFPALVDLEFRTPSAAELFAQIDSAPLLLSERTVVRKRKSFLPNYHALPYSCEFQHISFRGPCRARDITSPHYDIWV